MSLLHLKLKSFTVSNKELFFKPLFSYPYVVYFQNKQSIIIINVELNNKDKLEEPNQENNCLYFETDIICPYIQDYLLWLVLGSGDIVIINLLNNIRTKLDYEDHDSYKICDIKNHGNNLILISETGECFSLSVTNAQITDLISHGEATIKIFIKRAQTHGNFEILKLDYNGTYIYIKQGKLFMECPLTGLSEEFSRNINYENVLMWDNMIVLINKTKMWIIDLQNSHTLYESDENSNNCFLLSPHDDTFYYVLQHDSQIHICCVQRPSLLHKDQENWSCSTTSVEKISSQETLKMQLKSLVNIYIVSSPHEADTMIFQLQSLYEKIDDYKFLINTSLEICNHNLSHKLLLYSLQKRIYKIADNDIKDLLSDAIIKIELLEYITFRGIVYYKDINILVQNVVELCITFISKSDFDLACICWLKYSEKELTITFEDILKILQAVPQNIKISNFIIWLRHFIPRLLELNPFFIDIFVRWTTERVFLLEKSGYWPKIGLKFVEEITSVLEKSLKTIVVRPISMDDLDMLKDRILYLIELKEKYKINMLLGELSSLTPSEIALIMLRRCYIEDLQIFLQDYLPTYAAQHSFEMDKVLYIYIENEAASSGGNVDGSRLKILLNAFQTCINKNECLLQVLKVLDVPWDQTITDLAVDSAKSASKDFTLTDLDRAVIQNIQTELNYARIKIVLKKYNFSLTCTDYTMVLHKIVNASVIDLADLQIISKAMNPYVNYCHILYIDRRLQDCETRAALDYFNSLSNKEKRILLKTTMIKYEQIINRSDENATIERNYFDFLKGTQMLSYVQITSFEKMYHLKNSYSIKLNANDMHIEEFCAQETTAWINRNGDTATSECCAEIIDLAYTHKYRCAVLMKLLRRTSTNRHVRKLVEAVITTPKFEDISSMLIKFMDNNNISILRESINVLIELTLQCSEDYIHYLITYLSILQALINSDLSAKCLSITWKFHYIYLPISSIHAMNDLINFYSSSSSEDNLEIQMLDMCNKNEYMLFRIIAVVTKNILCKRCTISDQFLKFRDNMIKKILSKIMTSNEMDELLLTTMLLLLESNKLTEEKVWIVDTLRGQNESDSTNAMYYLSLPLIRRTFSLHDVILANTTSYPPQNILKSKFNLNLAEIVIPDITEETWDAKVVLFYVLKQYPYTDFERLLELCRILSIPLNYGLSLQLISLISTWDLKYKVFNDEFGCRQIYFENNEKELLLKCITIWEGIKNIEFIKDVLTDFWKNGEITLHGRLVSINPYYYEIYLCIFYLIYGSNQKNKEYFLLNFLKDYRRTSYPKQYEFELFSVKGMFPEIGYYRLPFHLFMRDDMWSHLKSEITLETYERWLPAVALLSLDGDLQTSRDMICSNALKQTMTSRTRTDKTNIETSENEPWRLISREQSLLRAAHRCVRYIANMEWAGACLFYVLQGCTRGADQVAAAQLCYQFAQRWAAFQPGNRAVRQMERLHSTLSTRHALQKIEWACEEFIRLSVEPVQLIRALYLHPGFVEKMMRHDVNRAANEIADKTGVNISSIRIQILESILEKSPEEKNKSLALNIRELMTAKYILKATCPKMGAIYLSRIAFDDDGDFNKVKKLRALQCLISVVEQDTAVKVANRERDVLWLSLLELLYTIYLENIDMPWIAATFTQDKTRALEQLVRAVKGNVDGLRVVAALAQRFGSLKLIHDVIPALLRASLHEEAIPLLKKTSSMVDDVIFISWRTIILSPFQHADYPITERQRAQCLNAINLLPVCPVIKDEDLIEIWKNCIRFKNIGIGCLTLPYMTTETRLTLKELLNTDKRNIIANLKNLHNDTYLVSGAMHVIENIMTSKGYRSK